MTLQLLSSTSTLQLRHWLVSYTFNVNVLIANIPDTRILAVFIRILLRWFDLCSSPFSVYTTTTNLNIIITITVSLIMYTTSVVALTLAAVAAPAFAAP